MFGNIGAGELAIIAIVILVFFGKNKLNDLAKGLGESSKEFKKLTKEYSEVAKGNYVDSDEETLVKSKGGES